MFLAVSNAIPVIDVSPLTGRLADRTPTVDAIAAAAGDWGFFQVTDHGLSNDLIDRVWAQTRSFFDLPMDVKRALARTRENPRGYYDRELTKNRRDLKEVFDFAALPHPELPEGHPDSRAAVDGTNRWPETLPHFRATMFEYVVACERLGLRLLGALCLGLGVDEETLRPYFSPVHTGFTRLNYYPLDDPLEPAAAATVTPLGDMALHHHSDAGALTILLQGRRRRAAGRHRRRLERRDAARRGAGRQRRRHDAGLVERPLSRRVAPGAPDDQPPAL